MQLSERCTDAAAAGPLLGAAATLTAADPAKADGKRKIKLGVVGCGGRGSWIAGLFKQNPGYEMHAVADYFQKVADKCGDSLGVAQGRRFSGLSGYTRVLESGVEAVALEVPPGFFPEMAAAAVEAGVHVYMAKPVALESQAAWHRSRRQAGDAEAAGILRRLPDSHRSAQHRSGQADPQRCDGPVGEDGHGRRQLRA